LSYAPDFYFELTGKAESLSLAPGTSLFRACES